MASVNSFGGGVRRVSPFLPKMDLAIYSAFLNFLFSGTGLSMFDDIDQGFSK